MKGAIKLCFGDKHDRTGCRGKTAIFHDWPPYI
jgi:hypothetical protein